jgi:hypothetical protein
VTENRKRFGGMIQNAGVADQHLQNKQQPDKTVWQRDEAIVKDLNGLK